MDCAEDHEKQNDWASALDVYKQVYVQEPTLLITSKLAWCYSRCNDFKAAKIECAKLIEIEPQNSKWLYMYGYQFYMEKNWIEAIKLYEKALESNPNILLFFTD